MTGVFAQNAAAYAGAGLPVFPVNTRQKKPAMKNWPSITPRTSYCLASDDILGQADGIGLLMGLKSGITEVDVDAEGDAWISAMFERFGDSPIVIRTASGKAKIWYRHDGEKRLIRPFKGLPIDILGSGYTIAPPSYRSDLGASYKFVRGGIANIDRLPRIKPRALERAGTQAKEPREVFSGERNNNLWCWGMTTARYCDDLDVLLDAMETHANAFPDQLPLREIERCAKSVWKYETEGKNYIGLRRPKTTDRDRVMDLLMKEPDAYWLLDYFRRWHSNRAHFAIAPTSMSKAKSPPWSRQRIERARDVMLEHGFLIELSPPLRGKQTGFYKLETAPK